MRRVMILECLVHESDKWTSIAEAFITPGNLKSAKMSKKELALKLEPMLKDLHENLKASGVDFKSMLTKAKTKKATELQESLTNTFEPDVINEDESEHNEDSLDVESSLDLDADNEGASATTCFDRLFSLLPM